ncbi:engB [Symbiodinium necroappetens]|uniref:EngB protein n=1 Tax=Symbiodinium necroappetens TaxID=1628268 RepID=A0A812SZL8_9DINO|nr:engB [Symbiodinium necroappetens]
MEDPSTNPAKVQKLRERAARPSHSMLRYLAENKIGRVQTQEDRKKLWYEHRYVRYAPSFIGQLKPKMRLWTAALEESQLPLARLPEIAVCGRSNSGKSTLLNYLCGQESANVRRFPGSTTELVFWKVGRPAQLCLVDLPGYGYAEASEEKRLQWTEFMLWYIRARKNLKRLLLLIDACQGVKPADREMIAYLERHSVPWQIIVTKCDKVPSKEIARRLTILKEDLGQYRRMAGDPVPVSALKRRGMDLLRDGLNQMKVAKEMVKEGIRLKVYDLLEQRRIRNRERRRRKSEKKAAAAASAAEAAEATRAEADVPNEDTEETEDALETDLHHLLGNWASSAPPREDLQQSPSISKAFFSLDDRDSRRVDSFMSSLFPDLEQLRAVDASPAQVSARDGGGDLDMGSRGAGNLQAGQPQPDQEMSTFGDESTFSDDEGEEDLGDIKPEVRRFDFHHNSGETPRRSGKSQGPSGPSWFPGLGPSSSRDQGKPGQEGSAVGLRRDQSRPRGDKVYSEDDFASPQDYAAGFRRWAPAAPTGGAPGKLMAEIRQRYEREWSMELEDVSQSGRGAPDAAEPQRPARARASEEPRPRMPFVTQEGLKPIPKGHGKHKVFGKPPARILKTKRPLDVTKALKLKSRYRTTRKRNTGTGLDWEDAKEQWLTWYSKHKRDWRLVSEADSPKKEDVDAAYETLQERRRQRVANLHRARHKGGRARDANAPRDESALPEWAGRDE